nr:isocitrate lyase/phosphoenolpyruvate mutase family protein [Mycobacterium leprae]
MPVIADADIGYGNRNNGARTVREYGASGVAVIYLDDTVFSKLRGAMGRIELTSAEDHATKIQAMTAARSSAEFLDNLVALMPG